MSLILIIQMCIAALAATAIYTIVGAVPGADETATLAPVTLVLILAGLHPAVVLAFFIAAIIACKLIDAVPVSVAGIPAGVMSTPLVPHALVLKAEGKTDISIQKIAAGAVVGTIVSIPISLILASAIVPFADVIKNSSGLIFFVGSLFLALLSQNKLVSLISIFPMALLIQGMRTLYTATGAVPEGKTVFISIFLAITIGPAMLSLLELLNPSLRKSKQVNKKQVITLSANQKMKGYPNPFKILSKKEMGLSALASAIGSFLFILSPVGLTVFLGELVASKEKNPIKKAGVALSAMEALAQGTYISGTLIPLLAIGLPLSPMAIGPANPLFNAPPVFTLENNLHHLLSYPEFVTATLIGAIIATIVTFYIAVRFSRQISIIVFKYIPHESLIALFMALVLLLAYMDGGMTNIVGVFVIGLFSGALHRAGVSYGVMFMTLYAAPWILTKLF
ncbi:tripartite tricarboxylate transporter permease [Fusibacter bizertensis]